MNDNMTRSKITKEIIADMPEELREDVRRYGDAIVNAYRRGCSDTEQKLSITSIGSKRPTDDEINEWVDEYAFRVPYDGSDKFYDDAAIKHGVAGAKWARDFKAASDSEKGGEKGVCGGMYCVSSESLVNGKPCKEWCGDKHCWRA